MTSNNPGLSECIHPSYYCKLPCVELYLIAKGFLRSRIPNSTVSRYFLEVSFSSKIQKHTFWENWQSRWVAPQGSLGALTFPLGSPVLKQVASDSRFQLTWCLFSYSHLSIGCDPSSSCIPNIPSLCLSSPSQPSGPDALSQSLTSPLRPQWVISPSLFIYRPMALVFDMGSYNITLERIALCAWCLYC